MCLLRLGSSTQISAVGLPQFDGLWRWSGGSDTAASTSLRAGATRTKPILQPDIVIQLRWQRPGQAGAACTIEIFAHRALSQVEVAEQQRVGTCRPRGASVE